MPPDAKKQDAHQRTPRPLPWVLVGMLILGLLAAVPAAWARPSQAPDFQTVPTLTPTSPPSQPTNTPPPSQPTNTPPPSQPTDTPAPATPTVLATPTLSESPAATASPGPTGTPSPQATAPAVTAPAQCWTAPTPGFQPAPTTLTVDFKATSPQLLVVPGQTVKLQLVVVNNGKTTLRSVLICNPLDPALKPGQPKASQGQVQLDANGLIATLGDLAAGKTATVDVDLTIPATQPLGGVIDNQAWLFSNAQAASTNLLTWALPPAWLPPTGQ